MRDMRRRLIAALLPAVAVSAGVTALYWSGYLWPIVTTIVRPIQKPAGPHGEADPVG